MFYPPPKDYSTHCCDCDLDCGQKEFIKSTKMQYVVAGKVMESTHVHVRKLCNMHLLLDEAIWSKFHERQERLSWKTFKGMWAKKVG